MQQALRDAVMLMRLVDEEECDVVVLANLDHAGQGAVDGRHADEVVLGGARLDRRGGNESAELGVSLVGQLRADELVERRKDQRRDGAGFAGLHGAIANLLPHRERLLM